MGDPYALTSDGLLVLVDHEWTIFELVTGTEAQDEMITVPAEVLCYRNGDGTWSLDGITYKYMLEISGRMPNSSDDITFVYLSNLENITFEQAWKAAGYSSNTADYFDVKDAVLIETKNGIYIN